MATARSRGKNPATYLKLVQENKQELDSEVGAIPGRQLRCRAGHHQFALDDWVAGEEEIPRGITVMPADEGRIKFLEPCLRCMAVTRVTHTHPGGIVDGFLPRSIQYGAEWRRMPTHLPRGSRVMRDEQWRRGRRQLQDLIGRMVSLDEDSSAAPVPAVRFKGA